MHEFDAIDFQIKQDWNWFLTNIFMVCYKALFTFKYKEQRKIAYVKIVVIFVASAYWDTEVSTYENSGKDHVGNDFDPGLYETKKINTNQISLYRNAIIIGLKKTY